MKCSKCGADVSLNDQFCLKCGNALQNSNADQPIQNITSSVSNVKENNKPLHKKKYWIISLVLILMFFSTILVEIIYKGFTSKDISDSLRMILLKVQLVCPIIGIFSLPFAIILSNKK